MASEKAPADAGNQQGVEDESPFAQSPFAVPPVVEPITASPAQRPLPQENGEREQLPASQKDGDAASEEASMRSDKSFTVPMLGRVSLGSNASDRVQTLAVFSGSLYFMLPMAFVSFVVTVSASPTSYCTIRTPTHF